MFSNYKYTILSCLAFIIFLMIFGFTFFIKIMPFIIFITPIFYIQKIYYIFKPKSKKESKYSESIFQKRLKKFKSIKRGYYSLIILSILYFMSLIGPLWMNSKPLVIYFANNKYDKNEDYKDLNNNGIYDIGENFTDKHKFYFPAVKNFFSFIPGIDGRYNGEIFNQKTATANFTLLNMTLKDINSNNFSIMPLYPFHPHDDLDEQLDDRFIDTNNNKKWDKGEELTFDYNQNKKWDKNNPPTFPSKINIAGTEESGRDVFSRLIDGYRISMTFAIIVSSLGYIIGIIVGASLGYFGGKWDLFGLRLIEIFSSIPFLFVLMILASFMKPGIFLLAFLSVILKGWIGITMYIRGEFFREKPKDYVSAAVSMGQSNWKIMFKHILPNSLTPIITFAPFAIIADIGTLVSLDFLGYGLQQPTSSWGHLLNQGTKNIENFHLLLFPIIALTLTIFMITFISEAIREAFDPRVYSRLR